MTLVSSLLRITLKPMPSLILSFDYLVNWSLVTNDHMPSSNQDDITNVVKLTLAFVLTNSAGWSESEGVEESDEGSNKILRV